MEFTAWTDKGIRKSINQDSFLAEEADVGRGCLFFAAVCDGMGGLSYGEHASGEMIRSLEQWFSLDLPLLLRDGLSDAATASSLDSVIQMVHARLAGFSAEHGACGTTLAGLLTGNGHYLCVNVGDSRVYRINGENIWQLTHDQTVAQDDLDHGRVTMEEFQTHPSHNVLLQCIGAGSSVVPAWTSGQYQDGDVFLLCSDGFRHRLSAGEIHHTFSPNRMTNEKAMTAAVREMVEEVMRRKERDNISVIVAKTEADRREGGDNE